MKKYSAFGGRRGQAAIEFLTTYGWAILVIVLVLAALVWMGVFNVPQVPERCAFQAGLECTDVRMTPTALLQLSIKNRMSNAIYICKIACTNDLQLALAESPGPSPSPPAFQAPPECASAGEPTAAILQPGGQVQLTFSPTAQASQCKNYFAGSLMTPPDTPYKAGDTYAGSLAVFYSLASDAGSTTRARMMTGDVVVKLG